MYKRLCKPLKSNSFFIFGARGTGKSTLIRTLFDGESVLEIDLLDAAQLEEALLGRDDLKARFERAIQEEKWIFIDEVQKAPKLLDMAQALIDKKKARFIFSGSSARKLKRGAANLLAGRAYEFKLFPLIAEELGKIFDLNTHLRFGGLPHVWNVSSDQERVLYLRSYISLYLKEEIAEEQIVRQLEPFAKFLQVAAQSSGQIVNYTNIAKDVGVSDQTVKTYFQILEDTLLGFTLPAFDRSIRKAQGKSPKFYLFDTGVLRALLRIVDQPFDQNHFQYGLLFEHFVISEIKRKAEYMGLDFQYSFFRTSRDHEIDLIIDRPGKPLAVVEIKSTQKIKSEHLETLNMYKDDFKDAELYVFSQDKEAKNFERITCLDWQAGLNKIVGQT